MTPEAYHAWQLHTAVALALGAFGLSLAALASLTIELYYDRLA